MTFWLGRAKPLEQSMQQVRSLDDKDLLAKLVFMGCPVSRMEKAELRGFLSYILKHDLPDIKRAVEALTKETDQ